MRRLLRILLNAATVLSLALCVVTVVTWMRSYGSRYGVELYFRKDVVNVVVYNGDLWIEHYLPDSATRLPERDWGWHVPYIAWYRYTESRWLRWTDYLISCWFLVAISAILPLARWLPASVRRIRGVRRGRRGLCRRCGYDCRATPDRCPECGTAIIAAAGLAREGKGETEGV